MKAADFGANGTSPIFSSVMPDTDDVKYAAEHFSVALSSLKVVSFNELLTQTNSMLMVNSAQFYNYVN